MEQGGVQGCQDSDLQNFQQFAVKNHRNSLTRQTRQTRLIALLVNLSTMLGYVRFVPTFFHEHIYIILHRSALPLCTHQTRGLHHVAETPQGDQGDTLVTFASHLQLDFRASMDPFKQCGSLKCWVLWKCKATNPSTKDCWRRDLPRSGIYLVIFLTTNNAQLNRGTTDTVGFLWLPDQHLLACCDGCKSAAKTKLCRSFWCQSIPMGPMAENW
jgi:hypothetical protein